MRWEQFLCSRVPGQHCSLAGRKTVCQGPRPPNWHPCLSTILTSQKAFPSNKPPPLSDSLNSVLYNFFLIHTQIDSIQNKKLRPTIKPQYPLSLDCKAKEHLHLKISLARHRYKSKSSSPKRDFTQY